MLASTASRAAGLHFCAVTLSSASAAPRPLDATVCHMLISWRQQRLALQGCTSVQSLAIFGVGFRRARSMRLFATCVNAGVISVSRCRAALLCSHWLSSASAFRRARSMRLCATCVNAGVNSVSRCRAALLCSHWLSSASAFAVPARCDCVPHASMLASTASRVAGLHFCAASAYLRHRLFAVPARYDCVPLASLLASTAARAAGLDF